MAKGEGAPLNAKWARIADGIHFRLRRLTRRSRRLTRAYYRLSNQVFGNEFRTVAEGIAAHRPKDEDRTAVYMLRRNIHMLEKGLTMTPRRPVFGLEYISETIETLQRVMDTSDVLGTHEREWMVGVVFDYFDAVRAADVQTLRALDDRFSAWHTASRPRNSGPAAVSELRNLVGIRQLSALAEGRRSIRWFEPTAVPTSAIDHAVRMARQAPTACNRQPYRIIILDDEPLLGSVAGIPMGTRGYAHQIPTLAVFVGDTSAFFDERDRHVIYIDASLAAMSFIFALEAQGIASCCVNWPDIPERERLMRKTLGLAPHEQVVMLVAFGYPKIGSLAPASAKGPDAYKGSEPG